MSRGCRPQARPRGVVLLALLIAVTLTAVAALAGMDMWRLTRQRALEQDLRFIGAQFRLAIERYYLAAPAGSPRVLPGSLADLLEDNRYPVPVRHLRRVYIDPMTGDDNWAMERLGRGVVVHSLAEGVPVKQHGFTSAEQALEGKTRYSQWTFGYEPPLGVSVAPGDTRLVAPVRPIPGRGRTSKGMP